jgi:hypothetical protein
MKKLLLLCSVPASILAITVACDSNSNVTPCESDADCAAVADVTPTCDVDLGQCVANNDECSVTVDCQIAYNQDGGATANDACEADSDCGADEICAKGFNDEGFCVSADDGSSACTDVGGEVVSVTKIGGGTADACLDPASSTSCDDGTCSFN